MVASRYLPNRSIPTGTVRVGVIGTGFGDSVHIPALKAIPYVEVGSVCSKRAAAAWSRRATTFASRPTTIAMSSADDDIDAVVIASPPNLHHSMSFAAIEAGKHVLCEKPMSRTVAEPVIWSGWPEQARVVAMVNHEFRFEPARAYARELIESGWLGEPHSANVTLNDPMAPRSTGSWTKPRAAVCWAPPVLTISMPCAGGLERCARLPGPPPPW